MVPTGDVIGEKACTLNGLHVESSVSTEPLSFPTVQKERKRENQ